MKLIVYLIMSLLFIACTDNSVTEETQEKVEKIAFTNTQIDAYVAEKLDDSQEYDVAMSLRFSNSDDTYEVIQYVQNDTIILFVETEIMSDKSISRRTFFKNGLPVYVEEYLSKNTTEEAPFIQRKIYLNGNQIVESLERQSFSEEELEMLAYQNVEISLDEFDFDRPKRAVQQTDEFALQFEEFIIIEPQTYLVLGNEESGYDAALFVAEEHPLLTEINENQEKYRGKTLHVYHQFVLTNGIERMLFVDAELMEE